MRADQSRDIRGMTPTKFDPIMGHQRTMTDEELDND